MHNNLHDIFKSAPDLSYELVSGIEKLKAFPLLLTGLSCIRHVYTGEEIKRDIADSLECLADIQKVYISHIGNKIYELDSIINQINDVFKKQENNHESS